MSPRSNIILWLFATVAVAALTAWAITQRVPATNPASNPAAPELSLHDWMHRHLEISPAQHQQIDPLETAYENEHVRLRQKIRQLGSDLAIAIRDSADDTAILDAQQKLNAAQGELQQTTLLHFLEMKSHLTPAQAEKLAAWTHDSILLQPDH